MAWTWTRPGTRSYCLTGGGRHPDAYHEWVLERMYAIDERAQGNVDIFLDLYEQEVKRVVRENPAMLRKWWWEAR